MRNSTTKLTSVNVVRPSTIRNVVRIDTVAMTNGTKARNDANTKASTANAPSPPSRVSTSTLGPLLSPPPASMSYEVRPASSPVRSAAALTAARTSASKLAPNSVGSGTNTRPNVDRPSSVRKRGSFVLAKSTTRTPGTSCLIAS
jgi:hypothetical protein